MSVEAERAAQLIAELDELTGRTRTAGRSSSTGMPMLGWGMGWLLGYCALDLTTGAVRIALVVLAWLAGMLLSWLPLRHTVRLGVEGRMRVGWAIIGLSSPLLLMPFPGIGWVSIALFLGGLWSMAMALSAVAVADRLYTAVALVGVVACGTARLQPWLPPLVWFGVVAGLPLIIAGLHRIRNAGHRG